MQNVFKIFGHPLIKWPGFTILSLLAIWLIGGNLSASVQEKKIEEKLEQFSQELPPTDFNQTTIELRTLVAQLGIPFYHWPYAEGEENPFVVVISESDQQIWEKLKNPLTEYLEAQLLHPTDEIAPIPLELKQYLVDKQGTLNAIKELIKTQELPVFKTDLNPVITGQFDLPIPSFAGLVEIQKILSLDSLEKQQSGKLAEAREMWETGWKINQSLRENPYLIGQLVGLINERYLTGTARKLTGVPGEWQQRITEHDPVASMITSLTGEFFGQFSFMRSLALYPDSISNGMVTTEFLSASPNWLMKVLNPLSKPYFRWSAIDTYQTADDFLAQIPLEIQRACSESDPELKSQQVANWNILGQISQPSFMSQVVKAQRAMLNNEFTQKILELKAQPNIATVSLTPVESTVCQGYQWVYERGENNTVSVSLSPEPPWLQEKLEEKQALPLSYTLRPQN